jgi:hypothetical protein
VKQSIRDHITGELTLEYFAKRFEEGWRVASVEWSRETADTRVSVESGTVLDDRLGIPYGFEITESGLLQENPLETTVLLLLLEQIIKEKRIQDIANDFNLKGYSTREGKPWSATDVFNLLPRLIEAGPSLLKSTLWQQRRPKVETVPKPN